MRHQALRVSVLHSELSMCRIALRQIDVCSCKINPRFFSGGKNRDAMQLNAVTQVQVRDACNSLDYFHFIQLYTPLLTTWSSLLHLLESSNRMFI